MNKLKAFYAYLCGTNFAYLLVLGLVVKAIVSDISVATFLLSIPVLSFEAYKMWLRHKTPDPIQIPLEMQTQLDNIKSKLNAQSFEKNLQAPAPKRFY